MRRRRYGRKAYGRRSKGRNAFTRKIPRYGVSRGGIRL